MRLNSVHVIIICLVLGFGCKSKKAPSGNEFPKEMVEFAAYPDNPVFQGTGEETWDKQIRERGYIIYEDGIYKMWYTGYNPDISKTKFLGYATSQDGISWDRYSDKPLVADNWIEDMFVFKNDGLYYMFAEGTGDSTHMLTSVDGIKWNEEGNITIFDMNNEPLEAGPYGTPTVLVENGTKYLFYERNDEAIWLASSDDFKTWKNIRDEPVIHLGPEAYDAGAVAVNQIIKYEGRYYMYYHGSSNPDWNKPGVRALWTSSVAMSTDLIHWKKYPGNPIVEGDHSSPILVPIGDKYMLYTMHDKVWRYDPMEQE